jgi:transcriptional regulator GlxA family with amidase domain
MVAVVESFLLGQIKIKLHDSHRLDLVNSLMIRNIANRTVDWLAKESCLSMRQFQRLFKERMGVSPKYFTKVVRFENAYRMKNIHPNMDWLTIAVHCGYHDYQHLAKDYQSITSKLPNEFHELELLSPERILGEVDTY